jgi:hypothetical protein
MKLFVQRFTSDYFRRSMGMYMRKNFMQRVSVVLYWAFGSYFRVALPRGCADAIPCFPYVRA